MKKWILMLGVLAVLTVLFLTGCRNRTATTGDDVSASVNSPSGSSITGTPTTMKPTTGGSNAADDLGNAGNALGDAAKNTADDLGDAAKDIVSGAGEAVGDVVNGAGDAVKGADDAMDDAARDASVRATTETATLQELTTRS